MAAQGQCVRPAWAGTAEDVKKLTVLAAFGAFCLQHRAFLIIIVWVWN